VKLFLVTRADLPPGQQAVQAAHALREFMERHPELDREWYSKSNVLALLAAKNEGYLDDLMEKVCRLGLSYAPFYEPDRGDELTAVAFGPECAKLVRGLPLALRDCNVTG
jgi:hypothetical protein